MSIKKKTRNFAEKCQFTFATPLAICFAIVTNPFFFMRYNLFKSIKHFAPQMKGKLLDFGCGRKPYEQLFTNCSEYVGCDIEVSGHGHADEDIDVFYDGKHLPFDDETFGSIFSSEVFEHVFNLEPIIRELNRVLKPGGKLLVTVPFVWNEHEVPYDFGRYTSFGLTALLERNGFKVDELRKSTPYVGVLFQMWIEYLRLGFSKIPVYKIQLLLQILFIFPVTLTGLLLSGILPRSYSLYGSNIVFATKVSPCRQAD